LNRYGPRRCSRPDKAYLSALVMRKASFACSSPLFAPVSQRSLLVETKNMQVGPKRAKFAKFVEVLNYLEWRRSVSSPNLCLANVIRIGFVQSMMHSLAAVRVR